MDLHSAAQKLGISCHLTSFRGRRKEVNSTRGMLLVPVWKRLSGRLSADHQVGHNEQAKRRTDAVGQDSDDGSQVPGSLRHAVQEQPYRDGCNGQAKKSGRCAAQPRQLEAGVARRADEVARAREHRTAGELDETEGARAVRHDAALPRAKPVLTNCIFARNS